MSSNNGYDPEAAARDSVVYLEGNSAPRVLFSGEDLIEVSLPAGTRVIYAKPPIPGLGNPQAAIRHALDHPENMDPLKDILTPGMKITIAIDDISLPLPMMRLPDVRQSVLEIVLPILSEAGVEDIHIIIATSFHRRMTPAEMKRAVGSKIFKAYYPDQYYNHDGEDPDGMVELEQTEHGERVRINRRAAESDLLIYININLVPMDGGHKSVGVGLCDYPTLQAHHTPQAILKSNSYMDPEHSGLSQSCDRIGRVIDKHLKVFHIETAMNNRMFDPMSAFLGENEDRWSGLDRMKFKTARFALSKMSTSMKRKLFFSIPAAYDLIGVHAGETEATHHKILKPVAKSRGQLPPALNDQTSITERRFQWKTVGHQKKEVSRTALKYKIGRLRPRWFQAGWTVLRHNLVVPEPSLSQMKAVAAPDSLAGCRLDEMLTNLGQYIHRHGEAFVRQPRVCLET